MNTELYTVQSEPDTLRKSKSTAGSPHVLSSMSSGDINVSSCRGITDAIPQCTARILCSLWSSRYRKLRIASTYSCLFSQLKLSKKIFPASPLEFSEIGYLLLPSRDMAERLTFLKFCEKQKNQTQLKSDQFFIRDAQNVLQNFQFLWSLHFSDSKNYVENADNCDTYHTNVSLPCGTSSTSSSIRDVYINRGYTSAQRADNCDTYHTNVSLPCGKSSTSSPIRDVYINRGYTSAQKADNCDTYHTNVSLPCGTSMTSSPVRDVYINLGYTSAQRASNSDSVST